MGRTEQLNERIVRPKKERAVTWGHARDANVQTNHELSSSSKPADVECVDQVLRQFLRRQSRSEHEVDGKSQAMPSAHMNAGKMFTVGR